jgi:hypothetical protein
LKRINYVVFVFNKILENSFSGNDKQKVEKALDAFFPSFKVSGALSPSVSNVSEHVPYIFIPVNELLCDSPVTYCFGVL